MYIPSVNVKRSLNILLIKHLQKNKAKIKVTISVPWLRLIITRPSCMFICFVTMNWMICLTQFINANCLTSFWAASIDKTSQAALLIYILQNGRCFLPAVHMRKYMRSMLRYNLLYFEKGFGTDEKVLVDILCAQDNKVSKNSHWSCEQISVIKASLIPFLV